jgi:hypothetical protein
MQVIESFKRFSIALLGALNGLRFGKPVGFLILSVGQVAFPGRTLSDAAKYMCVVSVAAHFGMPANAPCPFRITKPFALVVFAGSVSTRDHFRNICNLEAKRNIPFSGFHLPHLEYSDRTVRSH